MGIKIYLFIFIILSIMNDVSLSQVSREWISTYNYNTEDAKAIEVDNSGNVYVTGTSGTDYATVKYNSSGVQQWASRYNGTGNSSDYANSIAVDGLGNVYVTEEALERGQALILQRSNTIHPAFSSGLQGITVREIILMKHSQ
ncbi:MAG: SBBP repeat-containing protein [Ignavibacteria bacterium]|nr:SBBP repeat-containing protein [Ignavibacteria bacterium]